MIEHRWMTIFSAAAAAHLTFAAEAAANKRAHHMMTTTQPAPTPLPSQQTPVEARAIVDFWRAAGPGLWFAKDPEFDRRFRNRFLATYLAATRDELADWSATPEGALGLVILLDQFPRNAFRGTSRMYATDPAAWQAADAALKAGHDQDVEAGLRLFLCLPFGHSESLADQERSVALNEALGEPNLSHAKRHRDIIKRFGRFPHRNPILGRPMTEAEQRYLNDGGYAG